MKAFTQQARNPLLHWSGETGCSPNGRRYFQNFFDTQSIREMLIAYEFPEYMPQAVPFAFDGGGCFYIFDMRQAATNDEYPVLLCCAGNLDFTEAVFVAPSFLATCKGTTNPRGDTQEDAPSSSYELLLITPPTNKLPVLAIIRKVMAVDLYTAKRIVDTPSSVIARGRRDQIVPIKAQLEAAGAVVQVHERMDSDSSTTLW